MKVRGFVHVLKALEPRLDELVIVGGWAWYLYRKYRTAATTLPGDFTLDVDVVLPRPLPPGEMLDKLLEKADFECDLAGDANPPVTRHAWPSKERPEALVDFLIPARGAGEAPTFRVSGIVAQQLRSMDILLEDPLVLTIDESDKGEKYFGTIRIPRIGNFILQKALTLSDRRQPKREKDLFYVFDLADESRSLQAEIESDLKRLGSGISSKQFREAADALREDCGDPDAGMIAKVLMQIPPEQRPPRRFVAETFVWLATALEGLV